MIIKKNIYIFLFLLYLTLLIGFILNEDSIGGATSDYAALSHVAKKFEENFLFTLFNYNDLGHRHSPCIFCFKILIIKF